VIPYDLHARSFFSVGLQIGHTVQEAGETR
jgi:hypothetical protein